jgi:acyl phosphate:glycerol-3-phosphate acyltransferase
VNIEIGYVILYSYLIGSVPYGLILTKLFLNKDLRNIGSGNIGATNAFRTGKKSLGFLTLILDCLKGYVTILITLNFFPEHILIASLMCFLAHIFPVWLKFKGGKGIAVYLGILIALSYKLTIIFITTWLVMLIIFKYSSLSSLIASLMVFLFSLWLNNFNQSLFYFVVLIIVIFTHKENILRLKNKTENKIK